MGGAAAACSSCASCAPATGSEPTSLCEQAMASRDEALFSSAADAFLPSRVLCFRLPSPARGMLGFRRPAPAGRLQHLRPRARARRPHLHNDLFQRAEVLVHNRERILHLLRSHASPSNPHEPLQHLRLGSHDLAPVQAVHGSLARLVLSDDRCSGGIYNRNTRMLFRRVAVSSASSAVQCLMHVCAQAARPPRLCTRCPRSACARNRLRRCSAGKR